LYDLRASNIDRQRYDIAIEYVYVQFVDTVMSIVKQSVPIKNVTLGPRDPDYVTPLVKSLLRQRNRLRRKGRIERANDIAQKINLLISQNRSQRFEKLSNATSKQLWDAVNKTRNPKLSTGSLLLHDLDAVNDFFC